MPNPVEETLEEYVFNNLDMDVVLLTIQINDRTLQSDISVETASIIQYLIMVDKWLPIKLSSDPVAMVTVDTLKEFKTLRTVDPMVKGKLGLMCDGLISLGLLEPVDKDYIMSITVRAMSIGEFYHLGKVEPSTVNAFINN